MYFVKLHLIFENFANAPLGAFAFLVMGKKVSVV